MLTDVNQKMQSNNFLTKGLCSKRRSSAFSGSCIPFTSQLSVIARAVATPIIGGGHINIFVRVLPDGFLSNAIVFTVCEHEYMNMHSPCQLSRIVTTLFIRSDH
jgi:hypothetical protein